MSGGILFEAIIFLAGAVFCVPVARKLGLSSVLGYLFAGVLIGPYLLGLVGEEGADILHYAEFGVVMMLFLVGLETEPKSFWKMRKTIVGMGGAQVLITIAVTFAILRLLGVNWAAALTIGMAASLSSTAISLQTIKEKGMLNTTYGASSFAILLFQDIIVILMLAVLPLLSESQGLMETSAGEAGEGASFLSGLPVWVQTISIVLSIVAIVAAGRYLIVPMLRRVAATMVRELLVAASLLIILGIAFLMEMVGLSPALGAFLGGVVLANSEFKHELESNLDPFKGLLMGLFFMAVGASINFIVIMEAPVRIGMLVIGVIILKAIVLYLVGALFKLRVDQNLLLAVGLAQIGEFAFVLLAFALELNLLTQQQLDALLVVTALSMTLTPILAILFERFVLPRVGTKEVAKREADKIETNHKVLLLGFGHFGSTVGRFLRANGVEATVIDQDSNRVDLLRKLGFQVYYGDATRMDLLESAGVAEASIVICAIDNPESSLKVIQSLNKKYPKLKLLVRAKNRYDAYKLVNLGLCSIYRETLDTSVRVATDALHELGFANHITQQKARKFIEHDDASMRRLAEVPLNESEYIFKARAEIAQQELLLKEDEEEAKFE